GVRLKTIANRFVFSSAGISGAKFRILRMLCSEGKKRPSEIIKFAGGTKSNVSQRLSSLEKNKLVRKIFPKKGEDRRSIFIEITPKGEALVQKLIGRFQKSATALKNCFTASEIESQLAFLKKLNRMIDEREKEIPPLFD
ncbi:MAG: MarR family transcriptional regulator, partial [Patescibacteria group bacterium]